MARVSFGSRAGGASDYLANGTSAYRQSNVNGVYASLQDLTDALKREVEECTQSELPELTTCELSIQEDAILPLLRPAIGPYSDSGEHDLPAEYKTVLTDGTENYPGVTSVLPKATVASILAAAEGQPRQIVQRAASRAIVQALEATDGFKYSFNNAWAAKDEGGLRFSHICQDSMQNKDRHANGFTKTQKHLKTPGEGERGPRKPTYDCKGSVSVKFSSTRRRVDVYYRHYAIHSAVADRRPAMRPVPVHKPKAAQSSLPAKLYAELAPPEPDTGGLLGALQDQRGAFANAQSATSSTSRPEASSTGKSLKRKRAFDVPAPRRDPNKPLSLLELLQQSEGAKSPTATEKAEIKPTAHTALPPPIDYNLPSWQAPAPPPPVPIAAPPATGKGPTPYGGWKGAPYPPPYQPQQHPRGASGQTAPVAIPRIQSGYHTKPTPQAYQGLPSGKQHPKAQGLFSTLKPVRKEDYGSFEPHFVVYNGHRAKTSCYSCRVSKRKCDEGKPICSACARSGKVECVYEHAPNVPARAPGYGSNYPAQQPQQGTPKAQNVQSTMAPAQQSPGTGQSLGSTQQSYRTAAPVTPAYPMGSASTQGYATAASSQTFGAMTQSQSAGGQAKEGSPDPWYPRR
ncbi:hypothetical protein B0A55_05186 [Friedmanniomyces simplex]|uniref:Zn(2)-C6 fungal-type domain-containing protein n=1 Tax=Friedmanniomyces simplex TaxID=329884 RepID=A0A4V5NIC5_9PEZI|nr:hypothetical protein B0A55_05186 [Friedmanniomyces simplex]